VEIRGKCIESSFFVTDYTDCKTQSGKAFPLSTKFLMYINTSLRFYSSISVIRGNHLKYYY